MTKHRLLGLAVIFLVIATLACGRRAEPPSPTQAPAPTQPPATEPPPPPPTEPPPPTATEAPEPTKALTPAEENATLILENESEATICYVLISPAGDDSWGEDWLGDSEVIGPGDTYTFEVLAGVYDLEARDCEEVALANEWDQELDGTVTWTISERTLDVNGEPTYGTADLEPDFLPDPYEVDVVSGGNVDVTTLDLPSDCAGYVASAPDIRLNMAGDTDALRIFFVAAEGEDATLIVNDPNENWLCNDDFSGWDPMIEIENATGGQYDIWVGSHSVEDYILGTLYVTEIEYDPSDFPAGAPSGSEGGGLDIASDPAYGMAELSAGFQPDPHMVELVSGGPVDVFAEIGADCGGYTAEAPDYRVNLVQDLAVLRIFFVAASEADATLVINAPDGNWYCNDDFTGWDPMVEFENAPAGQYDVWVGSFSDDEFINGTLYVTEMDYDPDNLP